MRNNVYTIPAHFPFADTLAHWVLSTYGDDPAALPRVLILLPSRRACLSLREAFLRATEGRPLLLPRMQPLGDVDEDALLIAGEVLPDIAVTPAFEFRRLFTLAHLVYRYRSRISGHEERFDHALQLAASLAELLDEMEREQVSLEGLRALVPEAFAAHWQVTIDFLHIVSEHWPRIAAEEKLIGPGRRRSRMLERLAAQWEAVPPSHPVIAAGTTGSIPSTASLLKVIASLPQGKVVLPGLDTLADEGYFAHLTENHPQWGMRQLLVKLGYERRHVEEIKYTAGKTGIRERSTLLSEIMRPAETSEAWQNITLDVPQALQGITRVDAADGQEEAAVIALMLREVLETPAKTAALITHDRSLAKRVAALMRRFDVGIDDSAGTPLAQTPTASFLRLLLEATIDGLEPVSLLSLLKHPLTHAGMERIACLEVSRDLEIAHLRGVVRSDLKAKESDSKQVKLLLAQLEIIFAPLLALFTRSAEHASFKRLLETHLQCAEALAGGELWRGPEADALAGFLSELQVAGAALHDMIEPSAYLPVFETLLAGKIYRPQFGMHPRLKILSPIEARMQSFDRIILGGLNEGSWPPAVMSDPWFNRPMREMMGLPTPERKLGLAAHDFMMMASAPEVVLTRAEKQGGAPATPARWLVKLDILLDKFSARERLEDARWNQWAAMLNAPDEVRPCAPPAPTPPLDARPRQLSVTQIETWMRNPYAIYSAHILKLRPLKPLGADLSGADFGNAVHKALEDFVACCPEVLPSDAMQTLMQCGRAALAPLLFNATVEALWWPRFMRIASFVMEQERLRRPEIKQVLSEIETSLRLGDFTLTGRADRIELQQDNSMTIIDYKTGMLPAAKDIDEGIASQLVLLALMMGEGREAIHLQYWKLKGGEDGGKIAPVADAKIAVLVTAAEAGLRSLIEKYDNAEFPYLTTPIQARASRYDDYDHLARVKEWS